MTKRQFLRRMHFPAGWQVLEPVSRRALSAAVRDLSAGDEKASEHFRNGAFYGWLTWDLSDAMLIKLMILTAQDPDRLMTRDVRGHIRRREGLPTRIAEFLTLYETLETELEPA